MRIVHGTPPNFEEIAAALPEARTKGAIFCYGETVYNTGDGNLAFTLRAHEAVHAGRQGKTEEDVRAWWARYLVDPRFRLDEELPAHRAEYVAHCSLERDKEKRHRFLVGLAKRLSGPYYGGLIDFSTAKRAIRNREAATP